MSNITQIIVPSAGESVTEVEISDWLKKEGDAVALDESVLVLETDKATLDLPAPVAGKLVKILKQKGERVAVGEVVAEIEASGEGASAPKEESKPAAAKASAPEAKIEEKPPVESAGANDSGESKDESATDEKAPSESEATPAPVVAADAGKPKPEVAPAGDEQPEPEEKSEPKETSAAKASKTKPSKPARAAVNADREEEVVPMTLLRRKIAARLVEAQHTAALLTTFNEIDMSAVMALRKESQERFQERHQIKLGLMSFFIKATIEALKGVPQLNAEIRGNEIVYHHYHDIAVAIGGGRGLVVPVLRDAGKMSFAEIEQAIADFARRVKENKIKPDELAGGTFTITNGGVYGSLLSTPLVNPPQSGILGMHTIQDRPVAIDGQVVIRPMMYVALGYDHRLVDGREAVQFLKRVKDLVENPARMLLGI